MDKLVTETADVIRVKRDSLKHAWTMAVAGHWVVLPWADTADAVSVVTWLKGRTGGSAKIKIDL